MKINNNVVIEPFHCNITKTEPYKKLKQNIKEGGLKGKRVDLLISCVDNYAA